MKLLRCQILFNLNMWSLKMSSLFVELKSVRSLSFQTCNLRGCRIPLLNLKVLDPFHFKYVIFKSVGSFLWKDPLTISRIFIDKVSIKPMLKHFFSLQAYYIKYFTRLCTINIVKREQLSEPNFLLFIFIYVK
jgi:hypothetical protein